MNKKENYLDKLEIYDLKDKEVSNNISKKNENILNPIKYNQNNKIKDKE